MKILNIRNDEKPVSLPTKLRLKPSQILQEAKLDIKFGEPKINKDPRIGINSIKALQECILSEKKAQNSLETSDKTFG